MEYQSPLPPYLSLPHPLSLVGFDLVLNGINDLSLDTPNALDIVSKFIARAVVDDCIPPAYVNNHQDATNQIAL